MNSHDQAVQELMELFDWSAEAAEQMVQLEEGGFVMDPITGAILPDVDPDVPITLPLSAYQEENDTVKWN